MSYCISLCELECAPICNLTHPSGLIFVLLLSFSTLGLPECEHPQGDLSKN